MKNMTNIKNMANMKNIENVNSVKKLMMNTLIDVTIATLTFMSDVLFYNLKPNSMTTPWLPLASQSCSLVTFMAKKERASLIYVLHAVFGFIEVVLFTHKESKLYVTSTNSISPILPLNSVKLSLDFVNFVFKKWTRYGLYYCSKCNSVAHLDCSLDTRNLEYINFLEHEDEDEDSEPDESVDLTTYKVKKFIERKDGTQIPSEIAHFSHDHDLKFVNEAQNNQKCNGCARDICPPFYSCVKCKFFLHESCAKLPKKKRHPLHRHPLTLLAKSPSRTRHGKTGQTRLTRPVWPVTRLTRLKMTRFDLWPVLTCDPIDPDPTRLFCHVYQWWVDWD